MLDQRIRKVTNSANSVFPKSKMSHKSKRVAGKLGGHLEPIDPLSEVESSEGLELTGKIHDRAEKPTKLPKKIRGRSNESYRPI